MCFLQLWEEEHGSQGLMGEWDFMGPRACDEPGPAPAPGEVPARTGGNVAHYKDAEEEHVLRTLA